MRRRATQLKILPTPCLLCWRDAMHRTHLGPSLPPLHYFFVIASRDLDRAAARRGTPRPQHASARGFERDSHFAPLLLTPQELTRRSLLRFTAVRLLNIPPNPAPPLELLPIPEPPKNTRVAAIHTHKKMPRCTHRDPPTVKPPDPCGRQPGTDGGRRRVKHVFDRRLKPVDQRQTRPACRPTHIHR